jgi:hypothetical protein
VALGDGFQGLEGCSIEGWVVVVVVVVVAALTDKAAFGAGAVFSGLE